MRSPTKVDVIYYIIFAGMITICAYMGTCICDVPAQIVKQTKRAKSAEEIWKKVPARPGSVYVSNRHSYTLAATSRLVPSCFVDPSLLSVEELKKVSRQLAAILDEYPTGPACESYIREIFTNLKNRKKQGSRFTWVKREISREQSQAIRGLKNRAIGIQKEWRREYPNGNFAGPVLGFRRKDNKPGAGVEYSLDRLIKATAGKRVMKSDARRRPIYGVTEKTIRPEDGHNVYLTLDATIQKYLQAAVCESVEKFDAQWGVGIIMDPKTGDILAMVSAPTFDPNKYNKTPLKKMDNRCISCAYEPGSIFKPLFAASAVSEGLMTYKTKINCEGGVYHARRGGRISDHGARYGLISLAKVIVKSSNIGLAKIGERFGNRRLYNLVYDWGFGEQTGVDLPGELKGKVRKFSAWDGYSMRRVPFGQEITVTPLQIATAYCAFANGGFIMRPRLIRQISNQRGEIIYSTNPEIVRRIISEQAAKQSVEVMRDVVLKGTAKKSKSKYYSIWGKTGTAQVSNSQGYIPRAYTGSFIGGAPVKNPEVICLISIYRPGRNKKYYGGTVAGPYVKDVLEKTLRYLQRKPDLVDSE